MWTQKNGTDEPVCRAEIEIQTQSPDLWTQQGRDRLGRAESRRDVYTPLSVEQTHPERCRRTAQAPSRELPDDLGGGGGAGERGRSRRKEIRPAVGSHCCIAETNATLQHSYIPIKNKRKQ